MVVLKRLSDAVEEGDRIEAVILGSATNHNGRTNGLTAPSTHAQQAVIRQALKVSNIAASEVSYVETHGTGTALGDPIEVAALGEVFGQAEQPLARPLVLGAVKTNIGHTEAAAGVAGLIKAILAIQHQQIPANLHLKTPNPDINWESLPFELPESARSWTEPNQSPLTAGVSAFGFSGTNAHLVVQAYTTDLASVQAVETETDRPYLLLLSARSPAALNQLIALYAQYLAANPAVDLGDLCFTAGVGRSHFSTRLAIVSSSTLELRQTLVDVLAGRSGANCWRSERDAAENVVYKGGASEPESLEFYAERYVKGEDIDWKEIYQHFYSSNRPGRKIVLPTYPFQRLYYGPEAV